MAARTELPAAGAEGAHVGQPGWRRDFAVLCFAQSCAIVGFSLALPFLPLYVQTLGVPDPAEATIWAGAMSWPAAWPWRSWLRSGARWPIMAASRW